MPRTPARLYTAAFGSRNPAVSAGGRSLPLPSVSLRGPSQTRERFGGIEGVSPALAAGLERMQNWIARAVAVVKRLPFADSNVIDSVSFTAGIAVSVSHSLGRAYRGYDVVNVTGGYGSFQRLPPTSASPATSVILLQALNNCTGDVWVW